MAASTILAEDYTLTVLVYLNRQAANHLYCPSREPSTAQALFEACNIVVLFVTGTSPIKSVVNDPNGFATSGTKLLVIDCSKPKPALTRELAERPASHGFILLEAPLNYAPKQAWAGMLDVTSNGDPAATAGAVLECFAKTGQPAEHKLDLHSQVRNS